MLGTASEELRIRILKAVFKCNLAIPLDMKVIGVEGKIILKWFLEK
jgi:hypothetical protein